MAVPVDMNRTSASAHYRDPQQTVILNLISFNVVQHSKRTLIASSCWMVSMSFCTACELPGIDDMTCVLNAGSNG